MVPKAWDLFSKFSPLASAGTGGEKMASASFTWNDFARCWLSDPDPGYLPHCSRYLVAADNINRLAAFLTTFAESRNFWWFGGRLDRNGDMGHQSIAHGAFPQTGKPGGRCPGRSSTAGERTTDSCDWWGAWVSKSIAGIKGLFSQDNSHCYGCR